MKCLGNSRRRIFRRLFGVALAGGFLTGCHKKLYTSMDVEAGRFSTIESLTNIHASSTPYIKVFGKKFEHVRGDAPFFLKAPESDSILFVTQSKDGEQARLHLARLGQRDIISVELGDSVFGSGIRPDSKPGEYCDWIQSWSPTELILMTKNIYGEIVTTIDIAHRRVTQVQKISSTGQARSGGMIRGHR